MSSDEVRNRGSSAESSRSEIDYCIRTTNFLISTLRLPITPLNTLNDLRVEHLLRIHCGLHGINFESDFIPSASPAEDVARMILSLKDTYGADKFSALDAALIAQQNTTQVRFVLENFNLIINHQIASAQRNLFTKSESGNHLSVYRNSKNDISKADSFYVLPHPSRLAADETQETMDQDSSLEPIVEEVDDTDDSFETIENIVVNVVNESTTDDEQTNASDMSRNVNGNASTSIAGKSPAPLTSSPTVTDQKLSKSHLSPNVSVIKKSQSTVGNLQRSLYYTNPNKSISRSQSTPRNIPSSTSKSFNTNNNNSQPIQKNAVHVLAKRKQPPAQPKRKPWVSDTGSYLPRNIPSLRWLLPVDARFPVYHKGVIIPKCTSWRSKLKKQSTIRPPQIPSSDKCRDFGAKKYSTIAERGSQISEKQLELSEEESADD